MDLLFKSFPLLPSDTEMTYVFTYVLNKTPYLQLAQSQRIISPLKNEVPPWGSHTSGQRCRLVKFLLS
jgi:hypothetical protein